MRFQRKVDNIYHSTSLIIVYLVGQYRLPLHLSLQSLFSTFRILPPLLSFSSQTSAYSLSCSNKMSLHAHLQISLCILSWISSVFSYPSSYTDLPEFQPIHPSPELSRRHQAFYGSLNTTSTFPLNRRGISADPSCPDGFLCNELDCPSGINCPVGSHCVNFEGAITCAPDELGICALNPTTYEAVGGVGQCW